MDWSPVLVSIHLQIPLSSRQYRHYIGTWARESEHRRTRILGKTGLEVGEVGFGALFASVLGPGFEHSRQAVRRAVDLGINFFDTAPAYADSEAVLGRILADIRS